MPQVRRGTAARKWKREALAARCVVRYPPCIAPGEPLNRWSGRGRGTERTEHDREETIRLVRQASISRDDRDRRYAFFESDFLVEKLMGIDILPPIGILVSPHGLILAAYGKFANSSRYRQFLTGRPLRGAKIHFPGSSWGVVLLALGPVPLGGEGVGCGSYHRGRIRQNHLATK
jgi:hypothetical protein